MFVYNSYFLMVLKLFLRYKIIPTKIVCCNYKCFHNNLNEEHNIELNL